MQFTADMLGLELRASEVPGFSPLGAALSGAVGMGVYGSPDDLMDLPFESTSYTGTMDRAGVQEYYRGWKEAVRRVL